MQVSVSLELLVYLYFFVQAEDGIRDLVRSRGLGDVYKRQAETGDAGGTIRGAAAGRDVGEPRAGLRHGRTGRVLSLIHI